MAPVLIFRNEREAMAAPSSASVSASPAQTRHSVSEVAQRPRATHRSVGSGAQGPTCLCVRAGGGGISIRPSVLRTRASTRGASSRPSHSSISFTASFLEATSHCLPTASPIMASARVYLGRLPADIQKQDIEDLFKDYSVSHTRAAPAADAQACGPSLTCGLTF